MPSHPSFFASHLDLSETRSGGSRRKRRAGRGGLGMHASSPGAEVPLRCAQQRRSTFGVPDSGRGSSQTPILVYSACESRATTLRWLRKRKLRRLLRNGLSVSRQQEIQKNCQPRPFRQARSHHQHSQHSKTQSQQTYIKTQDIQRTLKRLFKLSSLTVFAIQPKRYTITCPQRPKLHFFDEAPLHTSAPFRNRPSLP